MATDAAMPDHPPPAPLRDRLRAALRPAMKARDAVAVAAVRSALAAIENAEAVDPSAVPVHGLAIEQLPVGAGAAEARRRELTPQQILDIVRAEVAERQDAARGYDLAGRGETALRLRQEAAVLAGYLPGPSVGRPATPVPDGAPGPGPDPGPDR